MTISDHPPMTSRGTPATVARLIELEGERGEVLSADFTLHRGQAEIAQAARVAIRHMPGVRRIDTLSVPVPDQVVAGTHWDRGVVEVYMDVPVDDRLKRWALRAIASDDWCQRISPAWPTTRLTESAA